MNISYCFSTISLLLEAFVYLSNSALCHTIFYVSLLYMFCIVLYVYVCIVSKPIVKNFKRNFTQKNVYLYITCRHSFPCIIPETNNAESRYMIYKKTSMIVICGGIILFKHTTFTDNNIYNFRDGRATNKWHLNSRYETNKLA